MSDQLVNVCLASLPQQGLGVLAPVRCLPDVRVLFVADRAWVRWPLEQIAVLNCLLPVHGLELFVQEEVGTWRPLGKHFPAFDLPIPPDQEWGQPLLQALTPAPFEAASPEVTPLQPLCLSVRRQARALQTHKASAMLCGLADLAAWVDLVPSESLTRMAAAFREGQALLLGSKLPVLPGSIRYWGKRVLMPLGHVADPDLHEEAIREALAVGDDEIVLLETHGAQILSRRSFEPLSRAGVRLALREGQAKTQKGAS